MPKKPLSTDQLLARLRRCDARWEAAMARPGYRDESSTTRPFTQKEFEMYCWADEWRNAFHKYETALYAQPDVRAGMVEGLTTRDPLTIYEA